MDFGWSEEQADRYDAVLELTRKAFADEHKGPGFYTRRQWTVLAGIGLLGAAVPARYGGDGLGVLDTARLYEAFGRGWPDTGLVFAAGAHLFACATPLARFGSDQVRERYLPGMCTGELIAGNAMTEENAGSDVAQLATTARPVEGGYVLNGTKSFVSNGPVADLVVTYATTDPECGHLGQTAFVVDTDSAEVRCAEPFAKMGLDSVPAGTVSFQECFVPTGNVLGVPGGGAAIFQHSMSWERTCLFAGYLGLLDRVVDEVCARVDTRRQFGRRLAEFQAVSHRVADMKARAESARLLLYRACWELDQGERADLSVALAKLAVSEAVVAGALDAVRLFGADGYRTESGIEQALRDSVPSLLFSGTSDVQKNVITREMGL